MFGGEAVTEQEWLESRAPSALLRYQRRLLGDQFPKDWSQRQAATPRKWRLFGCACVRRVWPWLSHAARMIIETTERFADAPPALAGLTEFRREVAAWSAKISCGFDSGNAALALASGIDMVAAGVGHARRVVGAKSATKGPREDRHANTRTALDREAGVQSDLARCVFGNPFRPITFDSACRTPTVASLASAAYDERQLPSGELDLHRLAVLADALVQAGAPGEVVAHLRSPGPHVRGCWAVDLCLGRS